MLQIGARLLVNRQQWTYNTSVGLIILLQIGARLPVNSEDTTHL